MCYHLSSKVFQYFKINTFLCFETKAVRVFVKNNFNKDIDVIRIRYFIWEPKYMNYYNLWYVAISSYDVRIKRKNTLIDI